MLKLVREINNILYLIFKLKETCDEVADVSKGDKGYINFGMGEWEGGGITMTPPPVEVRLEVPRQESAEPLWNDL